MTRSSDSAWPRSPASPPAPAVHGAVVDVRDVVKHYDGGLITALDHLSFAVGRGELLAIMGPSGCGKSTLLGLIGALDVPSAGEIRVEGEPIRDGRHLARFRASTVGLVFQHHHLIPFLTLRENVEAPMYATGVSRDDRRARAARLLGEVGLGDRMGALPGRVSGGERQRAALARALANEPRILLADEPTGSVDVETGRGILERLVTWCRRSVATMIVATHNAEVAAMADRTLFLRDGRLEREETRSAAAAR